MSRKLFDYSKRHQNRLLNEKVMAINTNTNNQKEKNDENCSSNTNQMVCENYNEGLRETFQFENKKSTDGSPSHSSSCSTSQHHQIYQSSKNENMFFAQHGELYKCLKNYNVSRECANGILIAVNEIKTKERMLCESGMKSLDMPTDYRTFMKHCEGTTSKTDYEIKEITGGEFVYFGFEKRIEQLQASGLDCAPNRKLEVDIGMYGYGIKDK